MKGDDTCIASLQLVLSGESTTITIFINYKHYASQLRTATVIKLSANPNK